MERELNLGGMTLRDNHGDIDIYMRDDVDRLVPTVRLQRADVADIVRFLRQVHRNAR